ncbi:putative asparagine synthase [Mycena galopus ATCC 62051]|nr:putative asparagine synthase [Mycena galopus ATCC 62051]
MCGIVACYAVKSGPETDKSAPNTQLSEQLAESLKKIAHRGPDSSGVYVSDNGRVGLGHVRLSIIDLEGGQQPMHSHDGTVHAVVNGELYDYASIRADLEGLGCVFQTFCDSELVIHLYQIYGQNMLRFLRGEFAFVIYDSKTDTLFAGRDRVGIKPLYYTVVDGRILLASEIKALTGLGWKPFWDVDSVLNMGDYNDDRTIFRGVYKVPAAHFLTFSRVGKLKIQSYWDHLYPDRSVVETRTIEEMICGVRERVIDSVKVRMRSDVPFGVYLSGGIDSAAVAGVAAQLLKEQDPGAKLATFTLAFPDREELDEGPVAQRMAESIGAIPHMVTPSEADLVQYFERSVYHAEMPVSTLHGAGKIILSEYVRNQGYKVVLSGEGSDETFGGYSFLLLDYLRAADDASRELGIFLPTAAELAAIVKALEGMKPPQDHISISEMSFTDSPLGRAMLGGISTHRVWSTTCVPKDIFSNEVLRVHGAPDHAKTIAEGLKAEARTKAMDGTWHPLNSALYTVTNTMLSNGILTYVGERPEMAGSIEGRPPFLDHQLLEYADLLPPSVKILPRLLNNGDANTPRKWAFTEKYVLREAVKPFVTEEIYARKKSQYNVPISRPTTNGVNGARHLTPLQELLKQRITFDAVDNLGWANWDYIGSLLDDYMDSPVCPVDGGLDKRARILLCVLSFIILQARFAIPKAVISV